MGLYLINWKPENLAGKLYNSDAVNSHQFYSHRHKINSEL